MQIPLLYGNGKHEPAQKEKVCIDEVSHCQLSSAGHTQQREEDEGKEGCDCDGDYLRHPVDADDANHIGCLGSLGGRGEGVRGRGSEGGGSEGGRE